MNSEQPELNSPEQQGFTWEADMAYGNPFMRRQLLLGFGVAFGVLWVILELISWFGRSHSSFTVAVFKTIFFGKIPQEAWFAFGFVGLIVVLTVILTKILMPSGYRAQFRMDGYGASVGPAPSQKKLEGKLAWVLMVGGAARRNPGAVGQGILLKNQTGERIDWPEVKSIEAIPEKSTIILHGEWRPPVPLICAPENFANVLAWVKYYTRLEVQEK